MVSNYEKTKLSMQSKFLEYDQETMIRQFHLDSDSDYLYLNFFNQPARIHRKTGVVECFDPNQNAYELAEFDEAMTIFDLLCDSKETAAPSGELVIMEQLARMQSGWTSAKINSYYAKDAAVFDQHDGVLRSAFEKIGGTFMDKGDVCAEFEAFAGVRMRIQFWNSDEDFEPQLQFFWDSNVQDFIHYETVWYANNFIIRRVMTVFESILNESNFD